MVRQTNKIGECRLNSLGKTTDLREDAKLVIEVLSEKEDVQLDFTAESISWLDTYIDQHRSELDARDKEILQEKFGAFLGESIRRNYGGEWVRGDEDRWMIAFGERGRTSPFDIIGQHLDHHIPLSQIFQHIPDQLDRNAAYN